MVYGVGFTPASDGHTPYKIPEDGLDSDQYDYYPTYDRMRYVGIKDKNKNKIYERDIVRYTQIIYTDCSGEEIQEVRDPVIGEICYVDGLWLGLRTKDKTIIFLPGTIEEDEFEVIGDMYNNPDLLP